MRNWGWLMTAVGYAGLSGMLAIIGAAVSGFHNLTSEMLGVSLLLAAASLALVFVGGRLRARGKPLLPISLSS